MIVIHTIIPAVYLTKIIYTNPKTNAIPIPANIIGHEIIKSLNQLAIASISITLLYAS